jgi:hypothetical protein
MEKKIDKDESKQHSHHQNALKNEMLSSSLAHASMLHRGELEHKRTQRLKRDHRRTRVIRTAELEPADENIKPESAMNGGIAKPETILEQSPYSKSPSCDLTATPDDKSKDPDWVNPWVRTPLAVKKYVGGVLGAKRVSDI